MRVLSAHKRPVNCVTFSPDGTRLAEAAHGGDVRVWDLASGAVTHELDLFGLFPNQIRLAFSPDGRHLAATNADIVFVDLASGARRRVRGREGAYFGVAWFPDGKSVVGVGDRHGRYSPATGGAFPRMKLPVPTGYTVSGWPACALTRDGARLAVSRRISRVVGDFWRNTEQVLIYDTAANAVVGQFEWTGHHAHRVAFAPDGALVAAACGPVLRVWDAAGGALVAEERVGKLHVLGMAFAPDGRYVATVSKDRTTRLWEVGAWGEPKTFAWDVGKLLDVAFAPDGATAAVASDTGKIVLFDVD